MTTGIRTITFLENSKRSSDNFGKQRGNIFIRSYRVLHKKRQGSFVTFSCLLLSFLRLSRATQIGEDIIEQISKERERGNEQVAREIDQTKKKRKFINASYTYRYH